mmetsp:Transcript_12502/g.50235  ORF Transcript_12502/g.50235 Transcript_12502/m.50235 type:complete len:330 (+) Transcript_12502:1040-2029(+)
MLMSFESARMSGSLSCMRPAVSTRTASHPMRPAALIASDATLAGSFSYPLSKSGTPRRLQCVRSCSTAPALNVSHAAIITLTSCCRSQYATLDRLVDLPTPLTPTKTIVYGLPASLAALTSRRISTDRLGVKILVSASSIAVRTIADSEENDASFLPRRDAATDSHSLSAMSSATFLFMKFVLSFSSTGSRSSSSKELLPTTPCTRELPRTPDSHDRFFFPAGLFRASVDPSSPSSPSSPSASTSSSTSSSSEYSASSSSSSILDGFDMSTRSTSSSLGGALPPSEKSSSLLALPPPPPSPAHTRFSLGFLGCLASGDLTSSLSDPPST